MTTTTTTTGTKGNESGLVNALLGRFVDRLVRTPAGRIFLLNFLQSTEESDEGGVFDLLVSRVEDTELQKLVKVHRADEERHASIFANAVARAGGCFAPMPAELHIVDRLNTKLGDWSAAFRAGEVGVMEMYALLLVVEERAVATWPALAAAMRPYDSAAAADIERVVHDETRHVKYARAISARYAPDPETLERTLDRVRRVEEAAYQENAAALMRVVVDRDLLDVSFAEGLFWRGVARANTARLAA